MQSFQIILLIIMTNPVSRAKVFLNELKQAYDKKFPDGLPSASIDTGESSAEDITYYETAQREIDLS